MGGKLICFVFILSSFFELKIDLDSFDLYSMTFRLIFAFGLLFICRRIFSSYPLIWVEKVNESTLGQITDRWAKLTTPEHFCLTFVLGDGQICLSTRHFPACLQPFLLPLKDCIYQLLSKGRSYEYRRKRQMEDQMAFPKCWSKSLCWVRQFFLLMLQLPQSFL